MLFQVINALVRAIDCTKKDAFSYATIIDREGRCIVCCDDFNACNRAKASMAKQQNRGLAKPLKVKVFMSFSPK